VAIRKEPAAPGVKTGVGERLVTAEPDPVPVDDDDDDRPRPTRAKPRSFEECYRDCHETLVRVAFLLTGSRELAQDVVQDAFVHLHGKWLRVREPEAYLRRSVVNGCRSQQRRAARERAHRARERAVPVTHDALDRGDLDDALAALPYRQRAALVLRFFHDLSEAQTADALGCQPGTVGSLVHRGIEQLRRTIER
jgi:RNA polymerase sigma-70 factor (sigma-E family)